MSVALRSVETDEPTACAWRYQGGGPGVKRSWPRRVLRKLRDFALRLRHLPRPNEGQIVVLSDGPTDATFGNLRAVMRELCRRGRPPFLITTSKTKKFLSENLHSGQVDIIQLLAAVPNRSRRMIRKTVASLAPRIREVLPNRDGGCESWLETGLLAKAIAREWCQPAGAILVDADFEATRKGFLLGAKEAGVPSLMLQHGTWGPMMFPVHATVTACWGELSQREVAEYGLPRERTAALGSPRWDHLVRLREQPSLSDDRALCGGDVKRPLVLLISNTHAASKFPELYDAYFEGVARLLECSEIDVAVKLHPSEVGLANYEARLPAKLLRRLRVTPTELGLHRPLKACDVVYHVGSAASIEAILLGVPILFERGKGTEREKYAPPLYGGGEWCGPGDVVSRVNELAQAGAARDELLARQESYLDLALANRGHAAAAVADFLESFVQRCPDKTEVCLAG